MTSSDCESSSLPSYLSLWQSYSLPIHEYYVASSSTSLSSPSSSPPPSSSSSDHQHHHTLPIIMIATHNKIYHLKSPVLSSSSSALFKTHKDYDNDDKNSIRSRGELIEQEQMRFGSDVHILDIHCFFTQIDFSHTSSSYHHHHHPHPHRNKRHEKSDNVISTSQDDLKSSSSVTSLKAIPTTTTCDSFVLAVVAATEKSLHSTTSKSNTLHFLGVFTGRIQSSHDNIVFDHFESVTLNYTPVFVNTLCNTPMILIISGCDCCIHVYTRNNNTSKSRSINEIILLQQSSYMGIFLLPELSCLNSVINAFDMIIIKTYNNQTRQQEEQRIIAIACFDGTLLVSVHPIHSLRNIDTKIFTTSGDGLVSSLKLWQSFHSLNDTYSSPSSSPSSHNAAVYQVHLVVAGASGYAQVFECVNEGFAAERMSIVPGTDKCGTILNCTVQGSYLLVSTFSQELLFFYIESKVTSELSPSKPLPSHWTESSPHYGLTYQLQRRICLADAIRAVFVCDFTSDGVDDFILCGLHHVHIFHARARYIQRKVLKLLSL